MLALHEMCEVKQRARPYLRGRLESQMLKEEKMSENHQQSISTSFWVCAAAPESWMKNSDPCGLIT